MTDTATQAAYADDYEWESGLLSDFRFFVTDAYFGYDEKYQNGEALLLILEGTTDNDAVPTQRIIMSVGKGWEVAEGGAKAVREDGKDKLFTANAKATQFFREAIRVGAPFKAATHDPRNANIWKGLEFQLERKSVDYGKEIGVKETLLPTAFHVEGGAAQASIPAASNTTPATTAAATPAAPAPASASAASNGAGELSPVLRAKLRATAKECESHDAFIDKAFQIEGVMGDTAAEAAVVSESFYAEARAS